MTGLVWEIKKVAGNTYCVTRDRIDMLPIPVDLAFAKDFVRKARNPHDRVRLLVNGRGRWITSDLQRPSKPGA